MVLPLLLVLYGLHTPRLSPYLLVPTHPYLLLDTYLLKGGHPQGSIPGIGGGIGVGVGVQVLVGVGNGP